MAFTAEQHKKHYSANREKLLKNSNKYYLVNREKLMKTVRCERCGSSVQKSFMTKHQRTNKCILLCAQGWGMVNAKPS